MHKRACMHGKVLGVGGDVGPFTTVCCVTFDNGVSMRHLPIDSHPLVFALLSVHVLKQLRLQWHLPEWPCVQQSKVPVRG